MDFLRRLLIYGKVEFRCPEPLVKSLFEMQWKIEDGARSHGLGDKGGNGLPFFNESLRAGHSSFSPFSPLTFNFVHVFNRVFRKDQQFELIGSLKTLD